MDILAVCIDERIDGRESDFVDERIEQKTIGFCRWDMWVTSEAVSWDESRMDASARWSKIVREVNQLEQCNEFAP